MKTLATAIKRESSLLFAPTNRSKIYENEIFYFIIFFIVTQRVKSRETILLNFLQFCIIQKFKQNKYVFFTNYVSLRNMILVYVQLFFFKHNYSFPIHKLSVRSGRGIHRLTLRPIKQTQDLLPLVIVCSSQLSRIQVMNKLSCLYRGSYDARSINKSMH